MRCDREVTGFIQCRSAVFTVDFKENILFKITCSANCLCRDCINVLVSWCSTSESANAYSHRLRFLYHMKLNTRAKIKGLSSATIYAGQAAEGRVYCYVPGQSSVSPGSDVAVNCRSEILKEGRRVCAKWPHQLLPHVFATVTACHADFFLARALNGHQTPSSFIVCVAPVRIAVGDQVEMRNVWCAGPSRIDHNAELLVPTILSTIIRRSNGADEDLSRNIFLELPLSPLSTSSWRDKAWFIDLQILLREQMQDYKSASELALAVVRTLCMQTREATNECSSRRIQYAEEFIHFSGQLSNKHDERGLSSYQVLLSDNLPTADASTNSHLRPDWQEACIWPLDLGEERDKAKWQAEQPTSTVHLLEPVGAQPTDKFVLLGRLNWHPRHNVFTVGRLDEEKPGDATPFFFTSTAVDSVGEDENWCPGRSLVICTGPRLITAKGAQPVCLFGQRMTFFERFLVIQGLFVLPSTDTARINPENYSALVEDSQILSEHLTIFVRYVGGTSSPSVFTLSYDIAASSEEANSTTSLGSITVCGEVARRAYCSGIFQVGFTLLLELPDSPRDATKPTQLISVTRVAQPFERRLSKCRHLVGLFRYKVLSVTEASRLLHSLSSSLCYLSPSGGHFRFSLQGLVAGCLVRPDGHSRLKGSIWLIDTLPVSTSSSLPRLRVDFFTDSSLSDLRRLPTLTRVCLFKARAYWSRSDCSWRLVIPLHPNRFQVGAAPSFIASFYSTSSDGGLTLESTMAAAGEEEEAMCAADPCPQCSLKVAPATQEASQCRSVVLGPDASASSSSTFTGLSLLAFCESNASGQEAKSYLVRVLRCWKLRIAFSRAQSASNPTASVQLKCLVSDGSAAAIITFDTDDFCPKPLAGRAVTTTMSSSTFYPDSMALATSNRQGLLLYREQLNRLSLLLGLSPSMTLDLLASVSRLGYTVWTWQPPSWQTTGLQDTAIDEEHALGQALAAWFTSPGFLRPLQLALVHSAPTATRQPARWRLRKTKLGTGGNRSASGEVYLAVPPYPLLRVA